MLRKVNRQLDERLPAATTDLLTRADEEQAAMPVVDTSPLVPLLERWRGAFAGYDVRGDLDALVDAAEPTSLPARGTRSASRSARWPTRSRRTRGCAPA